MKKLLLVLALSFSGTAFADLSHGTPLFSCTKPTQGIDSFGNLYTLPATGTDALKEIRFYVDQQPDATGFIVAGTTPKQVVSAATACTWQTAAGDLLPGSHSVIATAADNSGRESKASNPLVFTVPSAVRNGPLAPTMSPVQ